MAEKKPATSQKDEKQKKLAEALRKNLLRRKGKNVEEKKN